MGIASKSESAKGSSSSESSVRELLHRIRTQVRSEVERHRSSSKGFETSKPDFQKQARAGQILHSDQLRLLNERYTYASSFQPDTIQSHRGGVLGKIIVRLKRKFLTFLRDGIFHEYFRREQEFQEALVQLLNDQARYIDERDASNFWELVHKVDTDLSKAVDRVERLNDEYLATIRSTERSLHDVLHKELTEMTRYITELQGQTANQGDRLSTVESVASGLEAIVSRIGKRAQQKIEGEKAPSPESQIPDQSYLLLENRFRGAEEKIAEHLKQYLPLLKDSPGAVFEIGVGRGELLELLKGEGIEGEGVDIDLAMVEAAKERGVRVEHGDGMELLKKRDDGSLGAVIAIQVVEHLTNQQLEMLFETSLQKLAPGGKVVFETINPTSMLALSSNYFRDPTHVFPQHPDTLAYRLACTGFENVRIEYCSPVPEGAKLKHVPIPPSMTPQWQLAVEKMNGNIDRLNRLLYGYQDYFVVAEAPRG